MRMSEYHAEISPEHRATAYLMRLAEPPTAAVQKLISEHGRRETAQGVRDGSLRIAGADSARRDWAFDQVATDFAAAAASGARLLIPSDPQWPQHMVDAMRAAAGTTDASVPPLGLWVRGALPCPPHAERAISVVGSRAASAYGLQIASEFGYGFATRGYAVISGGAYGVDAAAHQGVLTVSDAVTIAVLPCAVDIAYPTAHSSLFRHIEAGGALLSEYPPGSTPARHRFLARNRIVAALGAATVVVEANRRSGTRNTVGHAVALGRPVMAVPGPITSVTSGGCHDLIRTGDAGLVTSPEDVLARLDSGGPAPA